MVAREWRKMPAAAVPLVIPTEVKKVPMVAFMMMLEEGLLFRSVFSD